MWVRTPGRPEYKDGRVVSVHGYIMDITDSKLAEERANTASETRARSTRRGRSSTKTRPHENQCL